MKALKLTALILLILLGLATNLISFVFSQRLGGVPHESQNASELLFNQYGCARQAVSPAEELDFISTETGELSWQNPYMENYFFAQFAMTPVLLHNGITGQALVLGYYPDIDQASKVIQRYGLRLVKDCGAGILIWQMQGKTP